MSHPFFTRCERSSVPRSLTDLWIAASLSLALSACGSSDADENGVTASNRAYITIYDDAEVAVINTDTYEVLDHIEVGEGPAIILDTPDRDKLYTANWSDNTVSAIDTDTGEVTNISMADRPWVIAMSPDGEHVYAGMASADFQTGTIAVIDTDSDEVSRTIDMDVFPASLIVGPQSETLYVATIITGNTLQALDPETGETIHEPIAVGSTPAWITIHPDGSKVYTLNFGSDDVTVVDTESWSVDATVDTGEDSLGIIGNVTPDGSRLYVTNFGTGEVIGIDTQTNEIVQTIELDGRPVGVEFAPGGESMWLTDFGPESLDTPTLALSSVLLTGMFPTTGDGQVSAFDVETGERVGEVIDVGPGPTSVVVR